MKYLLYLSSAERQIWGKDKRGWQRISGEPEGPVWVVTDLAEESFLEIKTPRLFGRDRSAFVARQLATRYPDTAYRSFMTPSQEGDLISIIAPTRHILFGIEAVERLNAELDALPAAVAGVWPISMLLAQLGQDQELPDSLFIVLPGPGTLRIAYLENRTPLLTRLILTPNEIGAQIDEISRTLRHLENTKMVPRERQVHSVLLLGDPSGFEAPMAAANLKLVGLRRWEKKVPEDWRFPLFDLTLKSPPGQVAPLIRRAEFLSARLSRLALSLAAAMLVAGVAAAGNNLWSAFDIVNQRRAMDASIQQINARIAGVEQNIRQFGVDPDTVRRAVALHDDEIGSVPDIADHLQLVAKVLANDPNLRLTDLQWRLLNSATTPCAIVKNPDLAPTTPEGAEPGSEQRKVELSIELALPDTYGPRDRAQALRTISSGLAGIEGLTLWQDATKDHVSGSLQGGSSFEIATRPSWCMTLPGTTVAAETPKDGSRP